MWRRVLAAALAMMLVSVLAACSIPVVGRVGIGRDHQGVLRVYLRSCDKMMSDARLEVVDDGPNATFPPVLLAEWHIRPEMRALQIDWQLQGPGDETVEATRQLNEPLTSTERVTITAWDTTSNFRSAGPWNFTLSELISLKPGEMLSIAASSETTTADNAVVGIETLNEIDCSQFG